MEVAEAPEFRAVRVKIETGDRSAIDDLRAMPIRDAELVLAGFLNSPTGKSSGSTNARELLIRQ